MSTLAIDGTVHAAILTVDYPAPSETVATKDYTVRVSAPTGAKEVWVAFDQGEWMACREAVGFWWFDWSGFPPGPHDVVARSRDGEGRLADSPRRDFTVAG